MRRLVLVGVLALGIMAGVIAPVASAHSGTVSISCTSVSFSYSDFPASGGVATETYSIDGGPVTSRTFTFSAGTASDIVTISVPSGTHSVTATSTVVAADGNWGPFTSTQTLSDCQPAGGLITETNVDCGDVLSGNAANFVVGQVNYSLSKGKIGQGINPGKFFYWVPITTTIPNQVVTVSQSNTSTNNAAPFLIHQGWDRLFTGDCGSWTAGTQIAGGSGASFTVPAPGSYIIGIKYDPKSLAGTNGPVPGDITYTFTTSLGSGTSASVLLKKG